MTDRSIRPHRCVESHGTAFRCWCGYAAASADAFAGHVESEREKQRTPYCVTTIPSADLPYPCGVEIRSTLRADEQQAIAVAVILPESEPGPRGRVLPGHFRHHEVLIPKSAVDFLVEALGKHKQALPEETPP